MNGSLSPLLDGQSCDIKPAWLRSHLSKQRTKFCEYCKAPAARRLKEKRRSFPIQSSLDDSNGMSPDVTLSSLFQELIDFARNAQKMDDPASFHNAVTPEARAAMKFIISRMLGSITHQYFDIRYSSITEQCETLVLSMLISGYMVKNAQDRIDLSRRIDQVSSLDGDYETHAGTHNVNGDVVRWKAYSGPESMSAREYIKVLEARIRELEEREEQRFESGEMNRLVEYMKSLETRRLEELAKGACEDVLLAMHICANELLSSGDPYRGPMTCSLPQKEMFRLMEWLMTFGYNLRCKELKHEMERAYNQEAAEPTDLTC